MRRISRKALSELYGLNLRTVDRWLKEMEHSERYPRGTVVRNPRVLIRDDAAYDYFNNRLQIKAGIAPAWEER